MSRILSVAPFVALPNETALLAREVRAMFTSVDGPIRQIWPFHAWPTYTGSPAIVGAQAGGYATSITSTTGVTFTGLHNVVDLSSAAIPLTWIVRFDRIGPGSEFAAWASVAGISTASVSILSGIRAGVTDQMNMYINSSDAQVYPNFFAAERMDCVMTAQAFGPNGKYIATSINGELVRPPEYSTLYDRATTTTDGRLSISNGSVRVRDVFIFNRQLSVEEVRELSQPGALWQFYRDPNARRVFVPAVSSSILISRSRTMAGVRAGSRARQ